MSTTKKEFSSKEIQRQLGLKRYEPVWAMVHKLSRAMGKRDDRYTLKGMIEGQRSPSDRSATPFKNQGRGRRGISWDTDVNGNPIVNSNYQGIGASIWWPNKDHLYDEADSVMISINVPKNLMDVSNGRLRKVDKLKDGTKTYQ
jgi:hypothetical protein